MYGQVCFNVCKGERQLKIIRVLNTNAVVSSDQNGQEIIITGPEIGFKKKKG